MAGSVGSCPSGVSGNPGPVHSMGMKASDFRSRIMRENFLTLVVFPNFGKYFFHSLPVPKVWDCFFSFPSRSRIVGMDFFNSLPIPEFAISQTGIKTGIGLL